MNAWRNTSSKVRHKREACSVISFTMIPLISNKGMGCGIGSGVANEANDGFLFG